MEEKKTYIKLKDLDGQNFTVKKVWGYKFKKWDDNSKTMLVEDRWRQGLNEEGYRKVYQVDTDKGTLDVSEFQLKSMLAGVLYDGVANLNNRTFTVKKVVGKNSIPNYYFNAVRQEQPSKGYDSFKKQGEALKQKQETQSVDEVFEVDDQPVDLSNIPF